MVKTTIKLCKMFFFHVINKNMQRKLGMKCLDSKLCNFVTSLELIKTPQNFVQYSRSSHQRCSMEKGACNFIKK